MKKTIIILAVFAILTACNKQETIESVDSMQLSQSVEFVGGFYCTCEENGFYKGKVHIGKVQPGEKVYMVYSKDSVIVTSFQTLVAEKGYQHFKVPHTGIACGIGSLYLTSSLPVVGSTVKNKIAEDTQLECVDCSLCGFEPLLTPEVTIDTVSLCFDGTNIVGQARVKHVIGTDKVSVKYIFQGQTLSSIKYDTTVKGTYHFTLGTGESGSGGVVKFIVKRDSTIVFDTATVTKRCN